MLISHDAGISAALATAEALHDKGHPVLIVDVRDTGESKTGNWRFHGADDYIELPSPRELRTDLVSFYIHLRRKHLGAIDETGPRGPIQTGSTFTQRTNGFVTRKFLDR